MLEQAIKKRFNTIKERLLKEHSEAVVEYILTAAKMMSVNTSIAITLAEQFNEHHLDLVASKHILEELGANMEYFAKYANISLNLSDESLDAANQKAIDINHEMKELLDLIS